MTTRLWIGDHAEHGIETSQPLAPFIKWPGGKSSELASIAAAAPPLTGRLIDPFVGGGSVLLATPHDVPAWANDACADLARLYVLAARNETPTRDAFHSVATAWDALTDMAELYAQLGAVFRRGGDDDAVSPIVTAWAPSLRRRAGLAGPDLGDPWLTRLDRDLPVKFRRMAQVQAMAGRLSTADLVANIEGAVRAAFYMAIRHRYNLARLGDRWDLSRSVDFLFLREFAYAAMFRFNAGDEFNVPYGGITYNRKSLATKVRSMFSEPMVARLAATEWRCTDFEPFLEEAAPADDDFVFVDPPYDSDFSAYDNLSFRPADQRRLKDVLEALPARVMVVIKDTPMIRELYDSVRWTIAENTKTYRWTIKSRNDRSATHLTITNY